MANKELNPSPKIPSANPPELSPNPNYDDGLIKGEHGVGTPENPNQEPLTDKPEVIDGDLYVNGKIYENGKRVSTDEHDDKGFDVLTLTGTSGTLTNDQYALALSDHCSIKLGDQYYYKESDDSTYLIYKSSTGISGNNSYVDKITITKSSKAWAYGRQKIVVDSINYSTTAPDAVNTDGIKVVVLDAEPATYYDGWYYIILGE